MGYSVRYRMMPALVDELRSSVKNNNTESIIESLINADILVLDDIGSEDDHSEWIRGRMLRIIDARMNKKTLYTSNLDSVDLFNKLDERIADRINQSQRLWLPLQSYRQLIREKGRTK
jgi:DNA replication protein DnaC